MPKQIYKILAIVLVIGLNWGGVSAVGYTISMFNDVENSSVNVFQAGVVDFSLSDLGFDPIEPSISLEVGDVAQKIVEIAPLSSNPFQYYVKSGNFSGDSDFCSALGVDVELEKDKLVNTGTIYSGSLQNLLTDATTTLEKFNYEVGMGTNNLQNKVCNFDLVYNGWQTRHNYPTYENGGFSDTESVSNTVSSWGLRLNKVYYDVADDRGKESDNEWIEVYNQTNVPLDISGWDICDNASCDTIPANTDLIPAKGYGVITATSTTWGYWFVPSEVVKIVLDDARIGNGLGNNGDALYLKRPDGYVVDEMNWQSNTDVWNPGAIDVAEGNVLARVPNGYDTDSASDWVELVPPVVDLTYPDEAGSYSWYWGNSYTIKWTALNPNGDDADLAIDLYYVKDINHDNAISEGDVRTPIVKGTANDGSYTWTLPGGFIGYIWIELVATGPENPMLNTKTISGDIWDPLPIYIFGTDSNAILDALANPEDDNGEVIGGSEIVNGENPTDGQSASGESGDESSANETNVTSDDGVEANNTNTDIGDVGDGADNGDGSGSAVVPGSDVATTTKEVDMGNTKEDAVEGKDDDTASTTLAVLGNENRDERDSEEETTATTTPEVLSDTQNKQAENDDTASTTPEMFEGENVASSTPEIISEKKDEKTNDGSGVKEEDQSENKDGEENKDITKDVREEDITPEVPKSSENSDAKDVKDITIEEPALEKVEAGEDLVSQPKVDEPIEQEPILDAEPDMQQDFSEEQEKVKDIPIKLIVKSE